LPSPPDSRFEPLVRPHEALSWRAESTSAIRKGPLKLIRDRQSNVTALFDVVADPGESKDLSAARPTDVEALLKDLDGWNAHVARR
jgi:hypothetical protein